MEIIPGIGLDTLLRDDQVRSLQRIGFTNKSYLTDSDAREVQYFTLRLVLKFEPGNDGRLGWIEVHNRDSVVFGKSPWLLARAELIELFVGALGEPPELEDYSSFESVNFPSNWVELQFQFGELSCINLGVQYDDNDSPIWPVKA
jgi:hypothetical protein